MVDRWFIRLDASNNVIHGFSDDFESPQIGDIQIPRQRFQYRTF